MTCDCITPLPVIECGPLARKAYSLCENPQLWPALAHSCAVSASCITSQADAVEWLSDALGVDALAEIDQRADVVPVFLQIATDVGLIGGCMGEGCRVRDGCADYHNPKAPVIARLCDPGRDTPTPMIRRSWLGVGEWKTKPKGLAPATPWCGLERAA